jgi:2-iminobutanoate/2-iminopropanoate deaminase
MAKIEPYAAKSEYDPPGYAQAIKVTGAQTILFLSGQVDYDANGNCGHPGDFKGQARAVLQALKAQVEAGGGSLRDIVKVNTYVTDLRFRPDYAAVRADFFSGKLPASTMVGVTALAHPDYLIEVEAIAVL